MTMSEDIDGLLLAASDAAYDWDLLTDSLIWFGAWRKIFATETPPQNSQDLYHALHPDDRHIVFNGEVRAINRQFRINQGHSGIIWVHEQGDIDSDARQPIRQRGIWRIIDQPAQVLQPSEGHNRDQLTGCFKRSAIQKQLIRAVENTKTAKRVAAYLVVSIDKMSFVNEAVGTSAGDAVLRGVATRLSQLIPTRAVLGRVGGDFFGILLPEPLGNDLQSLAEVIIRDFRNAPVIAANTPLHITVSIGGVRMPTVAQNANEAMIFAEQALHMARQRGRNTFFEYIDSPERAQENRHLLELGEQIKHAFKTNGFKLAYQPIVATASAKPILYEALVRMFGEDGKPISAALFVPLIEQLGLALELDKLVLDLAVRDMEEVPDLSVAINVSGLTASQGDWPAHIKQVLASKPDVARRLVMEITETAALVDIGETKRFVTTLRELGGRIALDDFGVGSTSIRYLRELDLSIMKIDKEMLNDILTDKEQQHLVLILIDLARGLGIETLVEGIETADVAAWLRNTRLDYMQGYFFGKPSLDRPGQAVVKANSLSGILL